MIVSNVTEALDYIKSEVETLNKKLDTEVGSFRKLLLYDTKNIDILNYRIQYISNSGSHSKWNNNCNYNDLCKTVDQVVERRDALLKILKDLPMNFDVTFYSNAVNIEHNKLVVEKIKLFMKTVGISESYYTVDSKSRARVPKQIKMSAGYLGDIMRTAQLKDNSWINLENKIKKLEAEITKWANDTIASIKDMEKASEAKKKEDEKINTLAALRVKYNLGFNTPAEDILDRLLDKNKYLMLAHYMMKNRNDWTDGCWYASVGLDHFIPTEPHDFDIVNCIKPLIDDWDGDGRVFRDCEWSYDRVFGLVSNDLYNDYTVLMNLT